MVPRTGAQLSLISCPPSFLLLLHGDALPGGLEEVSLHMRRRSRAFGGPVFFLFPVPGLGMLDPAHSTWVLLAHSPFCFAECFITAPTQSKLTFDI